MRYETISRRMSPMLLTAGIGKGKFVDVGVKVGVGVGIPVDVGGMYGVTVGATRQSDIWRSPKSEIWILLQLHEGGQ